jgi:chromosomal replication initiation ATPase DnaA
LGQLSFLLHDSTDDFLEENLLLLEENLATRNFLDKFFNQKTFKDSKLQSLILKGESFSGKSHLLHVFAKKFGAFFLQKEKISTSNLPDFFAENGFYILEDFDEIKDEEVVLRLINSAVEAKAFLILSAKNIQKFKLKDLVSRLKNIQYVEIKNPGLDSIKQLLTQSLSRRQIKLSAKVIDFIAMRIERSYAGVFSAVKKVESFYENGGKNLTISDLELML